MYVIDLFKDTDEDKIIEELIGLPDFFYGIDINNNITEQEKREKKRIIKKKYKNLINEFKKKDVDYSEDSLVVIKPCMMAEGEWEAGFVDLSDTETIYEVIHRESAEGFANPVYAMDFMDRNEILGYRISDYCVVKHGAAFCAACILDEITFFGIDEDHCRERQQEEKDSLLETVKRIEEVEKICSEEALQESRQRTMDYINELKMILRAERK